MFQDSSTYGSLPRLEHRLSFLPDVLEVHNVPRAFKFDPEASDTPTAYLRAWPPVTCSIEDKKKASVYFSDDHYERVGKGHQGIVYRVRLEHPDFIRPLGQQWVRPCFPSGRESMTYNLNLMQEVNAPDSSSIEEPFKCYSPDFYRALFEWLMTQISLKQTDGYDEINLNPYLSDEEIEIQNEQSGTFRIPWWVVEEKYASIEAQRPDRNENDGSAPYRNTVE